MENYLETKGKAGSGISTLLFRDALRLGAPAIYDASIDKWISNNSMMPVLFLSDEMTQEEISSRMLSTLSGIPESRIVLGKLTDVENNRLKKAYDILAQSLIKICVLSSDKLSPSSLYEGIRQHVEGNPRIKMIVADCHGFYSVFKNIASDYDVFIETSVQACATDRQVR
jgi:replicative DNA helicase